MIRVALPYQLRVLAKLDGEVQLDVSGPVTIGAILDALEAQHPPLRGTLRDPISGVRRPLIRFYACEEDHTFDALDAALPPAIADGSEVFCVVGAIAGG